MQTREQRWNGGLRIPVPPATNRPPLFPVSAAVPAAWKRIYGLLGQLERGDGWTHAIGGGAQWGSMTPWGVSPAQWSRCLGHTATPGVGMGGCRGPISERRFGNLICVFASRPPGVGG